jgi:serine phosphatase RsbU (regulator of sigma subunit)
MSTTRTIPAGSTRAWQVDAPRAASPAPWRAYLDIGLSGGPPSRRFLHEPHVVIGRVQGVGLMLDHHTVSRRHAEMFCDPFGRYWIRDLGSTNGTVVNGEPVIQRALEPGDRVALGDFSVVFGLIAGDQGVASEQAAAFDGDGPTEIRGLAELEVPRLSAAHLRMLLDFGQRLLEVESRAERIFALCQLVVRPEFHGTAAVALRLSPGAAPAPLSQTWLPGPVASALPPYLSRRVLARVCETKEPVIGGNLMSGRTSPASADGAGCSPPVELTLSRDVMTLWVAACPLHPPDDAVSAGSAPQDVLYATLPPECAGAEWLQLFALAAEAYRRSEEAWTARRHAEAHAAIERELETARQLQARIVPNRRELEVAGLDVCLVYEPCRWVGGDYADAIPMPDGRVLLAVADVCGKGLQAALVTSSLHTMVRATVDSAPSLAALVERVDRHLISFLPSYSFVTLVAAAVDPATGAMEYVNAGHPPAFIVARDGAVRTLGEALNPALGIRPGALTPMCTRLERGEVLAMYTDGLTEIRNGAREMLGQERLEQGLARICAASPGARSAVVAGALCDMLDDFREGAFPEDDRAFLVARRRAD